MKIYLTAIIKSKPEFNAQVLSVLQNMVAHSRNETGCIQYDLHKDKTDENTFVFYEIWENENILALHNEKPYIKAFIDIVSTQLQQPPLIIKMERI